MRIKLSKARLKRNIRTVYESCSDSHKYDWYTEAHNFAQSLVTPELSLSQVCGIIAALSPVKTWNDNKRIAALMVNDKNVTGIHMAQFANKARTIHENGSDDEIILQILRGTKISSFFMNIRYPHKSCNVTIDRHAISIAVGKSLKDEQTKITAVQYSLLKQCYVELAKELGISPLLLQSATWVKWREQKQTATV